jgi:hypothetical protein
VVHARERRRAEVSAVMDDDPAHHGVTGILPGGVVSPVLHASCRPDIGGHRS